MGRPGGAQLTRGRGVDLAFDHLGGDLLVACLRSLAPFGMLVSYNIVHGLPTGDVFEELRRLLGKSLAVRTFSIHAIDADAAQRRGLMEAAIALMVEGRVCAPKATLFPSRKRGMCTSCSTAEARSGRSCCCLTTREISSLRCRAAARHVLALS